MSWFVTILAVVGVLFWGFVYLLTFLSAGAAGVATLVFIGAAIAYGLYRSRQVNTG